jgi:3-isopropylmalate/(R)-2-methylmalate dehydratase small subunit
LKPYTTHTGIVATLNRANVDTDAIIPKQFLKSIKRTGYGPSVFFDWRYTSDGESDKNFELNQTRFEGRSILVTRNNFGCGSSRGLPGDNRPLERDRRPAHSGLCGYF